jgi:hypothetical protein
MALRVPPQHLPQIQTLLELPDEQIQGFVNALARAGAKFNTFDLAAYVSSRIGLPRRVAEGILRVLASIYLAREAQGVPLEMFLDEQVRPALKTALAVQEGKAGARTSPPSEDAEDSWAKFRKFLMATLVLHDSVGIAAKAGPVLTDHERIFVDARVLTDVRPIFHSDLSEKPNAAVLVHMLRITTRDILGNQRAQYFALDANDIRFMKHLMDRAIRKEETLNSLLNTSGVSIIAPKEVF